MHVDADPAIPLDYPEQIDRRLNWPLGTAARLARRKRLPHYVLPDGSLRFRWPEVEPLVRHVPIAEGWDMPRTKAPLGDAPCAIAQPHVIHSTAICTVQQPGAAPLSDKGERRG